MSRRINWLLALIFAALLSGACLLDGPLIEEHSFERVQADSLQDAIKAEVVQARFARAAQAICGENAAWVDVGSGVVQCTTKRGFKTQIAKVQP